MTGSRPMFWTSRPDEVSSDRIYLDMLGPVSGLRYSSQLPGGPKALSCAIDLDPLAVHRALSPGRDCGVTVGGDDVWIGTLNGAPAGADGRRQVTADGASTWPGRFVALGLGSHNSLDANEVLDAARLSGRHSRVRRIETLPVADGARDADGRHMLDETLTLNAASAGKRWQVGVDRVVRMVPYDGTGERLILHARQDTGRVLAGSATRIDIAYVDAATGLYEVEHVDAPPADTGSTHYPAFYLPDGSGYSARNFTLYTDGTTITAYVMGAPAAADVLSLDAPAVDLTRVGVSQFYSRYEGAGVLAAGAAGRTATFRAAPGGASLGVGAQDGVAYVGEHSLGPTGYVPARELVVDLTGQGAYTLAQALAQGRDYLAKHKTTPHYDGTLTASYGDLMNSGGVPVDLATVQAGVQLIVVVFDPGRALDGQVDDPFVTVGEVEYDVDSDTLTLTPAATDDVPAPAPYIDPATGLAR